MMSWWDGVRRYRIRSVHAHDRRGQAALSLVFLVGGITVVLGATLALLAYSFLSSGYGFEASQRAYSAARSGAADGILQLVRNKSYASAGYTVPTGTTSATVTVTQNSPTTGQVTITSAATVALRLRTVRAVAAVDTTTGQVTILSLQ